MSRTCACGHVLDEHDDRGTDCYVEGCDCIHFESDYDNESIGGAA